MSNVFSEQSITSELHVPYQHIIEDASNADLAAASIVVSTILSIIPLSITLAFFVA